MSKRSNELLFKGDYADHPLYGECDGIFESESESGLGGGKGYARVIAKEMESTPLSKYFFSDANVENLVQLCCRITSEMIKMRTGKVVAFDPKHQSTNVLVGVMQGAYLEGSVHPQDQFSKDPAVAMTAIKGETVRLNRIVLEKVTDAMYDNYLEYSRYKEDVTAGIRPNALPATDSVKGTRGTREITSVFFG